MRYDHGSRVNRRLAATLLRDLKGRLGTPAEAVEHPMTMQAAQAMPYWRLSKVAGVHVYRVDRGWHADLAFRDLPPGVPTLVGSAIPLASRQEALACAVRQLTLCQGREEIPLPEEMAEWPMFVFDEIEIPIEPAPLAGMAACLNLEGYTVEQAIGRLAYMRHAIAGDYPLTLEDFEAADVETKVRLMEACQVAMALGRTGFSPADGSWAELMPTVPGRM